MMSCPCDIPKREALTSSCWLLSNLREAQQPIMARTRRRPPNPRINRDR